MDDWGIATLARDLPALQSLNLSQHHTAVTDLTVRHLAPLQHLTSLSLCNCDRITDQASLPCTSDLHISAALPG